MPEAEGLEASALHCMSERETDRFIRRCVAALKSHDRDFRAGRDKENALSAYEATMALPLEVRDAYPARKADIDELLVRSGYPVPEN